MFASLALVLAIQPSDKWYSNHGGPYYPSFWSFGKSGVHIFNVNGDLMKYMSNHEVCLPYVSCRSGKCTNNTDCNYYRAVSDGRKNVYASNTAGSAHSAVQAYSMETGMLIADLETCGFPYNLDYAPHREEIWTHCWSPEEGYGTRGRPSDHPGDEGHLDVFSTNAMFVDHEQIQTGEIKTHGHGMVALDAGVPNYAYSTVLTGSDAIGQPAFFKIALNKRPKKAVPVPFDWRICPGGFYRFVINGHNKHAYLRCMVCCSCGAPDKDKESCGSRGTPGLVNITTGPSAGTYQTGFCGHSCENTKADVVGMVEYNLLEERVVGHHAATREQFAGNAAPIVSPLGDYVVMMTGSGEHNDILKTRDNGQLAVHAGTVNTGFKAGGGQAVTDVEFIEDATHNALIFAATTDNFIVLADMRSTAAWDLEGDPPAIATFRVDLQDQNEESSTGHGRGQVRSVVWAPKTDKVIINSGEANEVHILTLSADGDITKATLKTITDVRGSRYMVYVNNYEHPHSTCDEAYWKGPAQAAGWRPPCVDGRVVAARRLEAQSLALGHNDNMDLDLDNDD